MKKDVVKPGQRFNSLIILDEDKKYISPGGQTYRRFRVRCDCGQIRSVVWQSIKRGHTKSCGCLFAAERPINEPMPVEGAKWLPLTEGQWTLVDADVFESLKHQRLWVTQTGYAVMVMRGAARTQRVHRFILGLPNGRSQIVDHINGNTLDNRRCNLRIATAMQNTQNSRPKGSNQYKGVTFKKGKWVAQIGFNYENVYLGRYATITEAARAYNEAAKRLFGEFARLNIIPDKVQ